MTIVTGSFCILPGEDNPMPNEVKPVRPVEMTDEEISAELVNDSLGEETPADSTGLDSKEEAYKREHPA